MSFSTALNQWNEEVMVVYEYTIPAGLTGTLNLSATGAQGGYTSIQCIGAQIGFGGKGMSISGTATVGNGPGMIPPGSVIRYVLGEHGELSNDVYSGDQYVRGGSGGGSSAILFRAPGSSTWHVLMIAGGGGGGTSKCYPLIVDGFPSLDADSKDGGNAGFPYDSNDKYFLLDTGIQGGGAQLSGRGAGGGGFNQSGQQASGCVDPCTGGQNGLGWITYDPDFTGPEVYKSNGLNCIGSQERSGGRGFTGGGAGISRGSVAGSGGGGGRTGGHGGGGAGETVEGSGGGGSFVDTVYISAVSAELNPTSSYYTSDDGNGDFEFIPDAFPLSSLPEVDIFIKQVPPLCAGTQVTLVARTYYPDGSPANSFSNITPNVYSWYLNGIPFAYGEHFEDSTITVTYNPGDSIACAFWAFDDNACGKTVFELPYIVFREGNEDETSTDVVITADPGNEICYRRVYNDLGGYNIEAWAVFRATSNLVWQEFPNGPGNTFYMDPNSSYQERALRACEAEYGVGNCSIGTHTYWCTPRPAYNKADSIVSGIHPLSSQLGYPQGDLVSGQGNCGSFTYYYKTGTSQESPLPYAHQFVFDATVEMYSVNQDFSTVIIPADTFTYEDNGLQTVYNTEADTIFYPHLMGVNLVDKFPFKRTFQLNKQWALTQPNLGFVPVFNSVEYQPTYNWYRNGVLQGLQGVYTDTNGVEHPYTIPFTTDTLWIRNIAEGDVFTCQATSNHCAIPSVSNAITMHVSERSYGGVISGPEHPCPNSMVTYQITGATNVTDYDWAITGDATNITGTGNSRSFIIGTGNVNISCMPMGPCGLGDTAHFTVTPSQIITGPCYASQVVVTGELERCPNSHDTIILTVYDPADCYQWSTGESTQSIAVTEDGSYFVHINGCKSEVIVVSSVVPQQPTVSIAIDPAVPGQEGLPWCRQNNNKTMTATTGNYTGNPNIIYNWYQNGQLYSNQAGGLFLNMNTLNSFDTIQCEIMLDEECAISVWSNKVVLPEIFSTGPIGLGVSSSSEYGCSGDTVTFTALPYNGGISPTYTWRVGSTFAPDTTSVFKKVWVNNGDYPLSYTIYCTIFGSELPCRTGSNIKQINFTYWVYPKVTPSVSISTENTAVCPGNSITFTAHPTNGGSSPIYQWFKNDTAVGANDPIYTSAAPVNGDVIYCRLTNTDEVPCVAPPAQSNSLTVKVYVPLSAETSANPSTVCLDQSTDITATLNAQPGDFIRTGFVGPYSPGNWGQAIACNGGINTVQAPASISISVVHPPYGPEFVTCNNDIYRIMLENATVSFDWAYTRTSSAAIDVPYLVIDGTEYEFPEIDYNTTQVADKTGHYSIAVSQGQTLALRLKGITYNTQNQSQAQGAILAFSNFTVETQPGINWYDDPTAGNLLGSSLPGEDFQVTPTTEGTINYYAAATGTDASCGMRSPVAINVVACNHAPVALCRNISVSAGANGLAIVSPAAINNGSYDTDGDLLSYSANPAGPYALGETTVTLTVTDTAGATSSCNAIITVLDDTPPLARCRNISVGLSSSGERSITADQINRGSTDNCGIASIAVTPNNFTCADIGANTVTFTVTDNSGNSSTCEATVTVLDNRPPIASSHNISVSLGSSGERIITADQVNHGSWDNCGIASMTVAPNTFTCANIGPNTVILTVTDNSGNTSTSMATVTVNDNRPPIASCRNILVGLSSAGYRSITAQQISRGSWDNCGIATMTVTPSTFTCADIGVNTVTFTVTDHSGNTSTCTATVTVNDRRVPRIRCRDISIDLDDFGNARLDPSQVIRGTFDNCGIASMSVDPSTFDCESVGPNTVTLTVTDNSGNVSTCSSIVTVNNPCSSGKMASPSLATAENPNTETEAGEMEVSLFPNPSNDFFNVVINDAKSDNINIKVFDAKGNLVEEQNNVSESGTFRVGDKLVPGIYLVYVNADGQYKTIRAVKAR